MAVHDWSGGAVPPLRREAHWGDRVVACFPDRPRSLFGLLQHAVALNGAGEGLVVGELRLTWAEILERSGRAAGGLAARGVGPGDRVALLLGNRAEFILALFAVARLGAVVVPLGIRQQTPEIAHALNDSGARLLLCESDLLPLVPAPESVPDLLHVVAAGGSAADGNGWSALEGHEDAPAPAEVHEDDTAIILYTSGTTGRPKGAMLTGLGLVHSASVYVHCMELGPADRSIAAVPLSHVTGLVANALAMARCGGTLVVVPGFKAADFLAVASRERVTHTVMVPAMYNLCLLQPDFARHDLSAWRVGGYGGAPMPVPTIERLAEALPGLGLMNAYGATETSSPATLMPPRFTASHRDSVGLPVPGATVIVVDDEGHEVPPGETGEIWIHGPAVVSGYWRNPEATRSGFTGGFWHSGDVGSIDRDGFVRVFDRKKDMINRGGYKVFTAEVETVLASHEAVVECAVVGVPCPVLGERVHAFVHRRAEVVAGDLQELCRRNLADYKVPETITFAQEPLPRNANGKVLKRQLRETIAGGTAA